MPATKRKIFRQAFKTTATPVTLTAEQAQRFNAQPADGETVTLVALPALPASPFRTQDSRSAIEFSYDAAQLIAAHAARGRRVPLDVEHATEVGGGFTQPDTRARGWVHALATAETEPDIGLEPGVLYALVELTSLGAQELADKLYGYTSAVALGFWLDENRHAFLRIKSLTLTNNPACEMPMAFTAEGDADAEDVAALESAAETGCYTDESAAPAATDDAEMNELLTALRAALGLAEDADAPAVQAAVTALAAERAATAEQVTTLTARAAAADETTTALAAATAQLTALTAERDAAVKAAADMQAAEAERTVLAAVDAAIVARKATPAQRDALLTLARADLAAFTAAMAAAPEVIPGGESQPPAETFGLDADELARCKQLRIDPAIYARNKQAA